MHASPTRQDGSFASSITLIGVMPQGFQFPYHTSTTGLFDGFSSTAIWTPWDSWP